MGRYLEWYVDEPLVKRNEFPLMTPEEAELPSFEASKPRLPQPYFPSKALAVDAYWKAWELAWKNLTTAGAGKRFRIKLRRHRL